MDSLFILLQHLVPQQLLSRFTGWLAELQSPRWLKNWVILRFVNHFKVDMTEATQPNPTAYVNFNSFFTRALRDGVRPVAAADIVNPADGIISQLGSISGDSILQAKGHSYSLWSLLGGDDTRATQFSDGTFATIYLSPRDYHRVHMPVAGRLTATHYLPGKLFSVNTVTAQNVAALFARNERLVCYFDTRAGPMAMILVGAMVVAGIETVWSGQVAPPLPQARYTDYLAPPISVELEKGAEMGRFKLGSTVILLFPRGTASWNDEYREGSSTRLGEALGRFNG